ncbi:MAG: translation initiation factor IF-2 [Treponema berlinense]|uniref:translation initiation factor IF-2 n=1 Tax=Treponema berlinense TaxID=225004 RepID=UPI0023F7B49E|nr:translation initiation factor IF-2 [Treponema berlinense]MDY3707819.1 translation initiation factor IF-2 [Treponema berlinense]
MAEETEKKPGFVLNKKKTEPAENKATAAVSANSSTPEKKKIVVVKRKAPAQAQESAVENGENKKRPVPVVKKSPAPAAAAPSAPRPQQQRPAGQTRTTFEIGSARPNVKAGNLSTPNRQRNGGYNRGQNGGYGNREGGYNGGYGNRNYNNNGQRSGGFSGAQARENYQNRDRNGQSGGFNRQGGFNRGPNGQGGGFNRQGGFNRGPNGQDGGFNRGPNQGGRPGFGSRPGFGGGRPGFGGAPVASAIPEQKGPGKKAFKGKKQVYNNRKDKEELFDEEELYKKKTVTPASVVPKSIDIMESVSISDLAKKMNLKASEIIGKLMSMGMMVTINQSIDSDTATLLAAEYGCDVHLVSLYDETVIESDKGEEGNELPRPPIVTVMGHVDHGKTKTLDAIRKTNVAAGEAGGITQKIGAYQVKTEKGVITFLDTPGHEAFTMMRARGAQITDVCVLVVAADDGVMPQTLEALSHAKDAKVPIIVAVNKIDKPDANPDRVMTQLSEQGLTPEEWGGDTQYVKISALKGEGISELLDAILLQAEMLELKTHWDTRAEGKVIESHVDQGRGVIADVMVQSGTLKVGDPFVAGIYSGKVRAMFNDRGEKVKEATPSMPVEVLGLDEMPNAGDPFQVTETERDARDISNKRQELKRFEAAKAVKKVTLDNLVSTIEASEVKELKVIIKADLQGSAEALKQSLEKLSTQEIRLNVIHSSAGAINESDVTLAAADENAIIIGFNVRPTAKAKMLADEEKVEIRKYNVIYKCVEEIQQAMEGMLRPDTIEQNIGMVEVRNTFRVPKVGVIAGCSVTEGLVKKSATVNLIRDGIVKWTGKISSLKRYKDDAKEVKAGFECGIGLENWQDIQVGDQLEIIEYVEVARKLGESLVDEKAEAEAKAKERIAAAKAEAEAAAAQVAAEEAEAKAKGKAKKAAKEKLNSSFVPKGDAE